MGSDRGSGRGPPSYLLRPARRRQAPGGGCWRNPASWLGVAALLVLLLLASAMMNKSSRGGTAIEQSAGWQKTQPVRRQSWLTPKLDAYRVHAFYYLWYGNPKTDGRFLHWNHAILPHWNPELAKQWPSGTQFKPPASLHSPFYPARGPYSSSDVDTIRAQMRELKAAGVQVLVVSWWGPRWRPEGADTQGVHTDLVLPRVLEAAELEGYPRIAFHLEPYPGRSIKTIVEDLRYIIDTYGASPALLRISSSSGAPVPVYYVYDSYHITPADWASLLAPEGERSIRGTKLDGFFIGLWVHHSDGSEQIEPSGFDGFYTYFASEATSYASDPNNWPTLQRWAGRHGKLFVPSVGPGYQDSKIRPWNAQATRAREEGRRYSRYWEKALNVSAEIVSITSYNEWGEGTQIEPARVFSPRNPEFEQYGGTPGDEMLYMRLTREHSMSMMRRLGLPVFAAAE